MRHVAFESHETDYHYVMLRGMKVGNNHRSRYQRRRLGHGRDLDGVGQVAVVSGT